MSCYFCGGSRIASIHSAPDRGARNWSVGSMTLMRRYDGEPIARVELDTSVVLDVSVNGSCGDTVSANVTADAYIEDIKYCPFCGEELKVNESYKGLKTYLLNEIVEDARGVLNAIEGKEMDKVDDEEVLEYCHSLAVTMTTLETVAMVGRLVPWFLGDKGCEGE